MARCHQAKLGVASPQSPGAAPDLPPHPWNSAPRSSPPDGGKNRWCLVFKVGRPQTGGLPFWFPFKHQPKKRLPAPKRQARVKPGGKPVPPNNCFSPCPKSKELSKKQWVGGGELESIALILAMMAGEQAGPPLGGHLTANGGVLVAPYYGKYTHPLRMYTLHLLHLPKWTKIRSHLFPVTE